MTWLTNWNYRKPITISNSGSALTDCQINVTVSYVSSMQSNFNDIRFTDVGGNILPYWIESKTDSTSANVWIKVSSILASPSTTTIYLYYGNSGATSVSSYFDTFDVLGNGSSGSLTVSSLNTVVNNYTYLTGNKNAGDNVIAVNSGTGFSNGDEILIIQMQNYSGGTAGQYEFKKISSGGGTTSFTLDTPLKGSYNSGTFNSTNATVTQIVRVPQYTTITINSGASIIASAWNGYNGGISIFRATGTVNIVSGGSINVIGTGYRGGDENYVDSCASGVSKQGESYKGLGINSGYMNLSGGGSGLKTYTSYEGAGGGGGYGTSGSNGGAGGSCSQNYGSGGGICGSSDMSQVYLGSGGGGGGWGGIGAMGGGILLIFANNISVSGNIMANGNVGGNIGSRSAGGGGSGGCIILTASALSIGTNLVNVTGGAGGIGAVETGGVGGSGRIRFISNSISGISTPTAYTTGFDTAHNRKYASPEPTISATGVETPSITAYSMSLSQSEIPCRTGICTIRADITWQNLGSSSVTFRPKILIDGVTYVQAVSDATIDPYPAISSTIQITTPTLAVGTHSICPYPN